MPSHHTLYFPIYCLCQQCFLYRITYPSSLILQSSSPEGWSTLELHRTLLLVGEVLNSTLMYIYFSLLLDCELFWDGEKYPVQRCFLYKDFIVFQIVNVLSMTIKLLAAFLHSDSQNAFFQLPDSGLEVHQYMLKTKVGNSEKQFSKIMLQITILLVYKVIKRQYML